MKNKEMINIIDQLESMGYEVNIARKETSPSKGSTVILDAKNEEKNEETRIIIHHPFFMNLFDGETAYGNETEIFLTKTLPLSFKKKDKGVFLKTLNYVNSQYMFSKIFFQEDENSLCIIVYFFNYTKDTFTKTMNIIENNTINYIEGLKKFLLYK